MAPWRAIQDALNVYPRRHKARVGQSSFLASAPRQASFHHSFLPLIIWAEGERKSFPSLARLLYFNKSKFLCKSSSLQRLSPVWHFRFSWLCSFSLFCATLLHSPHSNQRRPFTEKLSACSFPLLLFRNTYYSFISPSLFSSETTCYLICTRTSCKQRHGTSGGSCNGCLSLLASPKRSKAMVSTLPWIIIPSYIRNCTVVHRHTI